MNFTPRVTSEKEIEGKGMPLIQHAESQESGEGVDRESLATTSPPSEPIEGFMQIRLRIKIQSIGSNEGTCSSQRPSVTCRDPNVL